MRYSSSNHDISGDTDDSQFTSPSADMNNEDKPGESTSPNPEFKELGLPLGWRDKDIPTQGELERQALAKMKRLSNSLKRNPHSIADKVLHEAHYAVHAGIGFANITQEVVTFGMGLKKYLQRDGKTELWHEILSKLAFAVLHNIKDHDQQSEMLIPIFMELGKADVIRAKELGAINALEYAQMHGLKHPDNPQWLLASTILLEAKIPQRTLEETIQEAETLLEFAERYNNLTVKLFTYMIIGYVYNKSGNTKQGFIAGQQAFVLARHLGYQRHVLFSLTIMMRYVLSQYCLRAYGQAILTYWQEQRDILEYDRSLQALYLSQLGPFLYLEKHYKDATKIMLSALALFEQIGDKKNQASMHYTLGMTYTQMNELETAEYHFNSANEVYCTLNYKTNQLHTCYWIAKIALKRGDPQEAIQTLEQLREKAPNHLEEDELGQFLSRVEKNLTEARSFLP